MSPATLIIRIGHNLFGEQWKANMAYAVGVSIDRIEDWSKGLGQPPREVWRDLANFIQEREQTLAGLGIHVLEFVHAREPSVPALQSSADARSPRHRPG